MDLVTLGCPLIRASALGRAMGLLVYLGHGVLDGLLALAVLAWGVLLQNRRARRAGLAAFLAVLVAGALANVLKLVFQLPRPTTPDGSYGFPSGHTTTAFALAATLGQVFPGAAPFFYLLAVLAGVARLYARSHFVLDVLGGSLLGAATGIGMGRLGALAGPGDRAEPPPGRQQQHHEQRTTPRAWWWAIPITVGLLALTFFGAYERVLAASRPASPGAHDRKTSEISLDVRFGTPEARALLGHGWSADETWDGRIPVVWAEGEESTLHLPPLAPGRDHRLRLRVRPAALPAGGAPCQLMEVWLNRVPLSRLLLERGWNDYEVKIPTGAIAPAGGAPNDLSFRFAAAGPPQAAAFASLEVMREHSLP